MTHTKVFLMECWPAPVLSQIRTSRLASLDIARPGPDQTIGCHEIFPHGLDHVKLIIFITVCKVIQQLITKIYCWCQTDLLGFFYHVHLLPIIHFSNYFLNNLIDCNCNFDITRSSWFMASMKNCTHLLVLCWLQHYGNLFQTLSYWLVIAYFQII